jgi:hypothetical protein
MTIQKGPSGALGTSIEAGEIGTGAVTADKIGTGAVTTAKIADANVTSGKLASGAAVSNIGYTPVNKAGDILTGNLEFTKDTAGGGGTVSIPFRHISQTNPNARIEIQNTGDFRARIKFQVNRSQSDTAPVDVMQIENNGIITMPYQPSFLAVRTTGTVSSGNIVFNDAQFNIGSHYDASNGRFTAPIAGRYLFCLQGITNNVEGNIYINVNKNGTLTGISAYGAGPIGYYKNISFSVILQLNANDYINLSIGSGQLYAAGDGGNPRFSGSLLG